MSGRDTGTGARAGAGGGAMRAAAALTPPGTAGDVPSCIIAEATAPLLLAAVSGLAVAVAVAEGDAEMEKEDE